MEAKKIVCPVCMSTAVKKVKPTDPPKAVPKVVEGEKAHAPEYWRCECENGHGFVCDIAAPEPKN